MDDSASKIYSKFIYIIGMYYSEDNSPSQNYRCSLPSSCYQEVYNLFGNVNG